MRVLSGRRTLPIVVILYVGSVIACVVAAGRPFAYPLDDTYIHMALARTLASTGVWGIEPDFPAAASSSPLWTLCLAAFYLITPTRLWPLLVWLPLVLNILAGIALLALWNAMLERHPLWQKPGWRLGALVGLGFMVSVTPLSLLGMEHVVHLLAATTLVWLSARALADDEPRVGIVTIGLLSVLAVAARYESLFVVAPLMVLAAYRRRFGLAAALLAGAALPVLAFGVYWKTHGGWLLPNSLILKAGEPIQASGIGAFWLSIVQNVARNVARMGNTRPLAAVLIVNIALVLVSVRERRAITTPVIMAVTTIGAIALQYAFASVGWLYRYEAWLIGLGVVTIFLLTPIDLLRSSRTRPVGWRWLAAGAAVLLVTTGFRSVKDFSTTVMAVDDRRQEHIAIASFVHAEYPGQAVVANDVGIIAYYGGAKILDMFGLANNQPVRWQQEADGYTTKKLSQWTTDEHATIAVLQLCWPKVSSRVPANWQLVEVWRIPRNVVFGDRDVGFFAINPDQASGLAEALGRFHPPPTVEIRHPSAADWANFETAVRAHRSMSDAFCDMP